MIYIEDAPDEVGKDKKTSRRGAGEKAFLRV
jgi:hypothetical protein